MSLFRRRTSDPDPSSNPEPKASLEASAPLESVAPLEGELINEPMVTSPVRRQHSLTEPAMVADDLPPTYVQQATATVTEPSDTLHHPTQSASPEVGVQSTPAAINSPVSEPGSLLQAGNLDSEASLVTEPIQLLAERLVVDRQRRKVGEVILRKEIETEMIQIPVRREKLIIEQITPEYRELARVELGNQAPPDQEINPAIAQQSLPVIRGEFTSAGAASQFLEQIANQPGCAKVQVTLQLTDASMQSRYQQWLTDYAAREY